MSWTFRTYVSPTGRNDVQKRIDALRSAVLVHFKARLRYLANTPKIDWHEPFAKKLQDVTHIYEIRFKAEKVQYRPLGCFGPGANEFTVLIWASKKQNIYDPSGAIKTADTRRKEIAGGQASCTPLTIDGEEFPPA